MLIFGSLIKKSNKQMKKAFIISVFFFSYQFSFSQTVCGVKEMEEMVGKTIAESQQKDKVNEVKYQKALAELGKVKKWDSKQEAAYGLKLIENKDIVACEDNKRKQLTDFMTILSQADEKNDTENNCKVIKQVQEKYNVIMDINSKEWNLMLAMINAEYKTVTKKDLVIE